MTSFFRATLGSVLTTKSTGARLLERLVSATQLEDRRSAIEEFKELTAAEPVRLIDRGGMSVLVALLREEDTQLTRDILETLSNLLDPEVPRGLADNMAEVAATHNASVFLTHDSNVTDVLNSSEDKDLYVRFHAVQVLMKLLAVARRQTQEALLNQPATVSRLMGLTTDRREIVRNEVRLGATSRAAQGPAQSVPSAPLKPPLHRAWVRGAGAAAALAAGRRLAGPVQHPRVPGAYAANACAAANVHPMHAAHVHRTHAASVHRTHASHVFAATRRHPRAPRAPSISCSPSFLSSLAPTLPIIPCYHPLPSSLAGRLRSAARHCRCRGHGGGVHRLGRRARLPAHRRVAARGRRLRDPPLLPGEPPDCRMIPC